MNNPFRTRQKQEEPEHLRLGVKPLAPFAPQVQGHPPVDRSNPAHTVSTWNGQPVNGPVYTPTTMSTPMPTQIPMSGQMETGWMPNVRVSATTHQPVEAPPVNSAGPYVLLFKGERVMVSESVEEIESKLEEALSSGNVDPNHFEVYKKISFKFGVVCND